MRRGGDDEATFSGLVTKYKKLYNQYHNEY